jgi:hypothetical protein
MLYSRNIPPPPAPSPDMDPSSDTPEDRRRRKREMIFIAFLGAFILIAWTVTWIVYVY